jgi:hypothetical protein
MRQAHVEIEFAIELKTEKGMIIWMNGDETESVLDVRLGHQGALPNALHYGDQVVE